MGSKDLLLGAQISLTRGGRFEPTHLYLVSLSEVGITVTVSENWEVGRVVYFRFLFDSQEFALPFRVVRSRELFGGLQFMTLEFLAILGERRRRFVENLGPYSSPNARLYYRHHCREAHEFTISLDSDLFPINNLSCGGLHFSTDQDYENGREFEGTLVCPEAQMDVVVKVERRELQPGGHWEYGLSFRQFKNREDRNLKALLYGQASVLTNLLP